MLYGQTRLLFPQKRHALDPFVSAGGAVFAGVTFDDEAGCVLTYNRTEGRLYWLTVSSGDVVQTALAPLPNQHYLLDMCQWLNVLYTLVYTGDGQLSVCVGNLQQGRSTHHMDFTEYPVPYQIPITSHVWSLTHAPFPEYLRYHPRYCGITNCGSQLFLLLGVSDVVDLPAPSNLGQYFVQYDLSGAFEHATLLDDSQWINVAPPNVGYPGYALRPSSSLNVYNGLGLAPTYRDGMLTMLVENFHNLTGVTKESTLFSNSVQTPPLRTSLFVSGPFSDGASMHFTGRHHFFLTNNRIFQANVSPFMLGLESSAGLYSRTIDMGVVPNEGVMEKYIVLTNTHPHITYKNIWIETTNVHTQVGYAVEGELVQRPPEIYQNRIRWEGRVAPGETLSFWLRILGPMVANQKIPTYYTDYLTLRAEGVW